MNIGGILAFLFKSQNASWTAVAASAASLTIATQSCLADPIVTNGTASGTKVSESNVLAKFSNKWAVLIGVDDFKEPKWQLRYATRDTKDFYNYLTSTANFKPDHVKLLTNQKASKRSIYEAMDWASARAKSNDLFLLYIRTRGVAVDNGNSPDVSAFFATEDTEPSDLTTGIRMADFVKVLRTKFSIKGIVVIADADYAEQAEGEIFPDPSEFPKKPQVINMITSTGYSQLAFESPLLKKSIFTSELLKAFRSASKRRSILEIGNSIEQNVNQLAQKLRTGRLQEAHTMGLGDSSLPIDIVISDPPLTK